MPDTQGIEDLGNRLHEIFIVDTQQEEFRFCGVGERTQNIKNCPEAKLPANTADIFHGAVIFLRKHEAESDFPEQPAAELRIFVNICPQSLQAVCRAALRRGRAVSVLGHLDPRSRDHHGGSRRDIECIGIITAGPHDLQHLHARMFHRCGVTSHRHSAA